MKVMIIGVGASGNKAVLTVIEKGVIKEEDTILVNSTSRDIPDNYDGEVIIISPDNYGCGKEVKVAHQYAKDAIKDGKFQRDNLGEYESIILVTSTEGGTGSGATPVIAQYFASYMKMNTHIIAFTGFEDDVRGMANTLTFFSSLDKNLMIQTISNASFMNECGKNKFRAEQKANEELVKRIRIITGMDFIKSEQNIDSMDIMKLSNTYGYMTAEKVTLRKPLVDQNDFNNYLKHLVMDTHSLKGNNPGSSRVGVILNISESSEDAIDYTYQGLIESFGKPYEIFLQKQWDGKEEYMGIIISGMNMPIEEIEALHNRYKEETDRVNKSKDTFFDRVKGFSLNEDDGIFDMIKDVRNVALPESSIDDFLDNLG
jgi:hypothetical protein